MFDGCPLQKFNLKNKKIEKNLQHPHEINSTLTNEDLIFETSFWSETEQNKRIRSRFVIKYFVIKYLFSGPYIPLLFY